MSDDELIGKIVLAVLMLVVVGFAPTLILWAINTLAEGAGVKFYIPHTIPTYQAIWLGSIGVKILSYGNKSGK